MTTDYLTSENFLLEGQFTLNFRSKPIYTVSVSRNGIAYGPILKDLGVAASGASDPTQVLSFDDAVGCDCMKGKKNSDPAAYLGIYAYPYKKQIINKSCRRRETLTLKFDHFPTYEENLEEALRWKAVITSIVSRVQVNSPSASVSQQKKMLVLVNPFSGPGKALHIFQQEVIPIFAESGLLYHLSVTEYAGHARELVKQIDLDEWHGIIIVSGDGLIFEVVNGLMERPDWEKAIKKPLGTIPGGSGNALACAVCHSAGEPYLRRHVLHSAFVIAKSDILPMDLIAVDTCTGKRLYSFLSIGWGMMADVDIESEKYRHMGNARFTVMAVMKIASMKKYRGRLSYLPFDGHQPDCKNLSEDIEKTGNKEAEPDLVPGRGAGGDGRQAAELVGASGDNLRVPTPLLVPLSEPVPSNWVTIEDEFILVGAVYQSHLAKDNMMAPDATLSDGIIHLVFTKGNITRLKLAHIFTNLDTGFRTSDPRMELVKVRAFRLEPLTPNGLMTVDGEVVDYGTIQAQVLPSMARIMSIDKSHRVTSG